MIVYIILFSCVLLLVLIDRGRNKSKFFWITGFLVFLTMALRNKNVGTDTEAYVDCWNNSNFYYGNAPTDVGFEAILRILRLFGTSNEYFIICISVIMMIGILYFIYKNSKYRVDSLLFFCIAGTVFVFFLLYLNAMRQCVAMTFFLIGITLYFNQGMIKKNKYIALGFILCTISIHGSSAIVLPVILALPYIKLNKKTAILLITVTYIIGALGIFQLSSFLSMLSLGNSSFEKYENYTQEMTFGMNEGTVIIKMYLLPFNLTMLYLVCYIKNEQMNEWTFKWLFIGTIMSNLMIDNLMWGRLLLYFIIMSIIVFPNLLRTVSFKYKNYVYLLVIIFFLRKVIVVLINSPLHAVLYNINTEVPYESWLSW